MAEHQVSSAILSVGDELILGQMLDTNAKWLADQLARFGIPPVEFATVPDDLAAQSGALRRLAQRADVVVCSGGLGPTADDLTRRALSDACGDALVEDPIAMAAIEAFFGASGRAMPAINRVQALRPSRGISLPNQVGTAPGLLARVPREGGGEGDVFCLPGPPSELIPMFRAHVAPRLRPPPGRTVRMRELHTVGLGESDLATRLGALMDRTRSPLVGTTASRSIVSCRIRYDGPLAPEQAERLLDDTEAKVRAAAGEYVFAVGERTLAGAVVAALASAGKTVVAVESCTGGMLMSMLTDVPGASAVVRGGWVTYDNALKTGLVGVPRAVVAPGGPGAVSREAAIAMAVGGRGRSGADLCVAITGIAGPEGGTREKPVGTVWIALASQGGADARRLALIGERADVRSWSAHAGLAMLWFALAGRPETRLPRQVEP